MEDKIQYGKKPTESFTVYKFEVNPVNIEISRVQTWSNISSLAAHKFIPDNYKLSDTATIKTRDYYLIVHLKAGEDNICYYYTKGN
jgi:hypothetical protein